MLFQVNIHKNVKKNNIEFYNGNLKINIIDDKDIILYISISLRGGVEYLI